MINVQKDGSKLNSNAQYVEKTNEYIIQKFKILYTNYYK